MFINYLKLLLLLISLLYLSSAKAVTCPSESKDYQRSQDNYFKLDDPLKLSDKEKQKKAKFLQSLEGKWSGTIVETNCKGSARSPETEVLNIDTKIKLSMTGQDLLKLDLWSKYPLKATSKDLRYILPDHSIYQLKLSKNKIAVTTKERVKFASAGTPLVEIVTVIERTKRSLLIDLTYYSNGSFVSHQVMKLKK